MLERARSLSRIQKLGVGITALLVLCCGCLGLAILLPSSQDEEAAELVTATDNAQRVSELEIEKESATVPLPPIDTPEPINTPRPTDAPAPSQAPTDALEAGRITLETGGDIVGDVARVTRIIDGDTIEVSIGDQPYRVRYIGMDTPERGEPFWDEATEANRQLVEGQNVILVKDVSETDRFGRLLRYVYLQDGTFVNAKLVEQGVALVTTYPPDIAHESDFVSLQQEARDGGRGLWADLVAEAASETPEPQPTNTTIPQPAETPDSTDTPVPDQPTVAPLPQPTNTQPALPTNTPLPLPTSTPLPLPTNTPLPPPTEPPAAPNVVITFIFFDGNVPRVESDEYAEITNRGNTAVNLSGWRLNADDPGQDFWFPAFEIQPGQSCRVYTNEVHPDTCGFSFGNGQALWNNSNRECGHLYDPSGAEVSTFCY